MVIGEEDRSRTMMQRKLKKRMDLGSLTSLGRFICVRDRTLYLVLSFILSQYRDSRIGSKMIKFRSFGDSTSSRIADKLKDDLFELRVD